jgi:hypothetical protein
MAGAVPGEAIKKRSFSPRRGCGIVRQITGIEMKPMASKPGAAKLSSPRIFLVRMLVFLVLCGLIAFVLQRQIYHAFMANPWLNALIVGVLFIGILLSFHRVIRLFPEVSWLNRFRRADSRLANARAPKLLAPMAAILGSERGPVAISAQTMRAFLDSLAMRLDEARDISRYLTGLLIFLGLLGTFWGLIETVGSVGSIINGLKVGGDAGVLFDTLKQGLAAPLGGMGISFSSSLFGLAGSLVLGFLDLQTSQAQNRFYTNIEDWLATMVDDLGNAAAALPPGFAELIERLRHSIVDGSAKSTTTAMANLAEAIQTLVQHMRAEQQMIRDWADAQARLNTDIRRYMERSSREPVD